MPTYDYKCLGCGRIEEITHGFDEIPIVECGECFKLCRKMFKPAATHFKGQGWGKVYRKYKPKKDN